MMLAWVCWGCACCLAAKLEVVPCRSWVGDEGDGRGRGLRDMGMSGGVGRLHCTRPVCLPHPVPQIWRDRFIWSQGFNLRCFQDGSAGSKATLTQRQRQRIMVLGLGFGLRFLLPPPFHTHIPCTHLCAAHEGPGWETVNAPAFALAHAQAPAAQLQL